MDFLVEENYEIANQLFSKRNMKVSGIDCEERYFSDIREFLRFIESEQSYWWDYQVGDRKKPQEVNQNYFHIHQIEELFPKLRDVKDEGEFDKILIEIEEILNNKQLIL